MLVMNSESRVNFNKKQTFANWTVQYLSIVRTKYYVKDSKSYKSRSILSHIPVPMKEIFENTLKHDSFFNLSIRSLSLKKRMLYWSEKNRLFRMKIHCIMYVLWKNVGKSDDQHMDLKCEQFQKSVDEMINSCKKIKNPLVLMTWFVFILSLCERSLMLRFFFALFLFIMLRIEHLSKWLQLISKVISIASPKFLVSIL